LVSACCLTCTNAHIVTAVRVLRTPNRRFEDLDGFSFAPRYASVTDGHGAHVRVHYLDEGPRRAAPVLLLHGEPSWSYLYRHIVPPLVSRGHRCIVPDLVGFGRSDKPASPSDYSYARHVAWMRYLVFDRLDLRDVSLFAQDWGGLIGLRLVADDPDRFARVAISNTGLPTGDERMSDAFLSWRAAALSAKEFRVGEIVASGCRTSLAPRVIAAYDAPFPDDSFKAGARSFPALVPSTPDDPEHDQNIAAWAALRRFDRPFLCAFSNGDPLTAGSARRFVEAVPGASGQRHVTIEGAGHFVQEDRAPELAQVLIEFFGEPAASGSL
jgi:haloalkane dehalogenase